MSKSNAAENTYEALANQRRPSARARTVVSTEDVDEFVKHAKSRSTEAIEAEEAAAEAAAEAEAKAAAEAEARAAAEAKAKAATEAKDDAALKAAAEADRTNTQHVPKRFPRQATQAVAVDVPLRAWKHLRKIGVEHEFHAKTAALEGVLMWIDKYAPMDDVPSVLKAAQRGEFED